jgi:hypothetical protein
LAQKSKRLANKRETQQRDTNIYDVLIKLIDETYALINSGNIIGIIAIIVLFILYKLPPENIDAHVKSIVSLLSSDKYYIIPLGGLLAFSVSINIYQRNVYKLEIKRLVEDRSALMHGKEKGELTTLQQHHSSNFNIENT